MLTRMQVANLAELQCCRRTPYRKVGGVHIDSLAGTR